MLLAVEAPGLAIRALPVVAYYLEKQTAQGPMKEPQNGVWPGCLLRARLLSSPTSTHEGIQPCEAARMEDATDTMRGLIVELSNLK